MGDSAGAPGLFRLDADTSPFGLEDATPGSRACVCACFSWPGRAGRPPRRVLVRLTFSCGRSWCALCLFGPLLALVALFVVVVGFPPPFFFDSLVAPPLCPAFRVFRPGLPWAWASCGPPAPPPFFFRPLVSFVRCFSARGAVGLGALLSSRVGLLFACFFFFPFFVLPPPPPPPPFSFACRPLFCCLFSVLFFVFSFPISASAFFLSPALVCRLCGSRAGFCVLGCGLCWCVLLWALCPGEGWFVLVLCRLVLPGCACSVCVVASHVAVWWCVLCVAWCCVGCLCWAWFFLRAAAPCCRLLVPCRGPWLCSVLRCGAALLWCAASRAVCCCGAVLFRSRWLVLCGVACGCWLFAAGSGCLPLFPAGVCCRGCSCLAAWLAALLCAVVCCCAPLPCAVSCVLRCFVAVWCRAVAPCCPFSFAGGVGLCLFPVCAVLCCAGRRVVRCRFGLRCCWCLVLRSVAVCCGVSVGVLRCGGAALVCRGVLLCRALSCGVLRPVLCSAVLCCLVVLCWVAVLCSCLRFWCLFVLLSSFPLLKTPAVFPYH